MTDPKKISILDYTYDLPAERIALHPLAERDASKLLVYKNGNIREDIYKNIAEHLPAESLLIFNNTRVIKARIRFQKSSGGVIEIFLLEPFQADYTSTLSAIKKTTWKCMIGGVSKWKEGELSWESGVKSLELKATLLEKLDDAYVVQFSWTPDDLSFAEVLEQAGDIPLPPYIKRKTETADTERYQTIYAKDEGSVAAPTAGLHFTPAIFSKLAAKNIQTDFVTLHVGAGTFKPVKAATMQDHEMHAEWIDVSAAMIKNLVEQIDKTVVAVGTTSLRTLESLYWMGVKANLNPAIEQLQINQWEVYEEPLTNSSLSAKEALSSLLNWMKVNNRDRLFTQSQILIAPGYHFKIAKAIITNFHQPQSTLLLLVSAAIGGDWKKKYAYAMQNNFRFLSYGDGSLLFIDQ
ncbi:MAG: S-adenosylmethionine:tRNA ribosyltransferase-isomerase [Chitinophagaceae bacterium]|nr:S-adenosylmethionine:tRNA ribosyltransferase-isomerase [Chitinophagaceae bacterium]MBK8785766.1 S-adenosylmethionine:tRNA ribosyltransferase-isomerase [Chitinophagaceae bacterium]